MSSELLAKAFELIESAPDESKILGQGVSDETIAAAESALNVIFPAEYKDFISRYGYGGVGGFEIFGLPTPDNASTFTYPYVVELNHEMRGSGLSKRILAFKTAGNGEAYGLDLVDPINPKVVVFWPGDPNNEGELEIVANSFGEHLLAEIERVRERLGMT